MSTTAPRWLIWLEKKLGCLADPQLAILLVTLQAMGFGFVSYEPEWVYRLALDPVAVLNGEAWRLLTYLSLPLSASPIWMFFALWFLYFIVNSLESAWGAFRTTFYVLFSWAVTVLFSLTTGYPVLSAAHFESSLFLAAAFLYPDTQVSLFFLMPVKLKVLGAITGALVVVEAARGGWLDRAHLAAVYSGFLLFFGPAALERVRLALRRRRYRGKLGR